MEELTPSQLQTLLSTIQAIEKKNGSINVDLKTYFEEAFKAHRREHELMELAKSETVKTMDTRLDSMNRFREENKDLGLTFATKESVVQMQQLVTDLRLDKSRRDGQIMIVNAFITLGLSLVVALIVKQL